jgi:hypothetical protein
VYPSIFEKIKGYGVREVAKDSRLVLPRTSCFVVVYFMTSVFRLDYVTPDIRRTVEELEGI